MIGFIVRFTNDNNFYSKLTRPIGVLSFNMWFPTQDSNSIQGIWENETDFILLVPLMMSSVYHN